MLCRSLIFLSLKPRDSKNGSKHKDHILSKIIQELHACIESKAVFLHQVI